MPDQFDFFHGSFGHLKAIVSTVLLDDQHVVMVREGAGRDRELWNLPGGKVDPGETLVEAAIRETREETGYDARVNSLLGLYRYTNRAGRDCVRYVFFADVVGGEPNIDGQEILDIRWFHLDQLSRMQETELCKPWVLGQILKDVTRQSMLPLEMLPVLQAQLVA